jgi:hypothetical protein
MLRSIRRFSQVSTLVACSVMLLAPVHDAAAQADAQRGRKSVTRSPFDPTRARPMSAARGDQRIDLVSGEPCTSCPAASYFRSLWTIEVRGAGRGSVKRLQVPGPAQIDDVRLLDDMRGMIIGQVQSSVGGIVLFALDTGAVIDKFLTLDAEVSPDGKRIAFVKVYPLHFVEDVSSQYLVYDTSLSAADNRHRSVSAGDEVNVGLPVYPTESVNVPGDNTSVGPGLNHQLASAGFFWSPDGSRLAFGDRLSGVNSVVVVDLSLGIQTPQVSAYPLESAAIVDSARCRDFAGKEAYAFSIANVEFTGNALRLEFSPQPSCARLARMVLPLRP